MTPQELKASILQLAIQGKLVEHFESEEAIVIHASFAGDTSDFFEIPDNWKWLSIKDVASVNTGLSFKKQDQRDSSNGSLRVLRGGNIGDDYKYHLYEDDVYVELEQFQTKYIQLLEVDIITPSVTSIEKICKTGYIDRELPKVTAGGFVYIIRCLDSSIIDPKYLMYFIASAFNKEQCKPNIHKSGQAFYNLKKSGFIEQPICVPPLAEQKRIVAKIEELLPLIDRYEQAWSRLEDFNKRFPVDMQKSILQMAIQGKLVPQLPEEGTGEDVFQRIKPYHKELKPCKDELDFSSMDFDIPESWTMVELNQLFDFVDYRGKTPTKISEGVFLITASNIRRAYMDYTRKEYISREEYEGRQSRGITQKGDLLFTTEAPMGNAALCDLDECSCGQRIITFKEYTEETVLPALFMYFILSPQFQQQLLDNCTGTTAKGIKADKLKHLLLPLPPYEEQKRIVAKLEEILPLCERLK